MAHYTETYPADIFERIQPDVEAGLERHESTSKGPINPFELVPIEDYPKLRDGYLGHIASWHGRGVDIEPVIRASYLINTATEDNLPAYRSQIDRGFEDWERWNKIWTSEEKGHGESLIREMEARQMVDMVTEWQPLSANNVRNGIHVEIASPADGMAYVAVQELLTRMAHNRTAHIIDPAGAKNLRKIAADESRHYLFYQSALEAVGREEPDYALAAMRRQHDGSFQMPGMKGIDGYARMAKTMAAAGVFDATTVLEAQRQTIERAKLLEVEPQTDEGKANQEWAASVVDTDSERWQRQTRLTEKIRERMMSQYEQDGGELQPFILGATVEIDDSGNYQAIAA